MGPNVRPLVHWAIYKGYRLRFTERTPQSAAGILTTPDGELSFQYDPVQRLIAVPGQVIPIDDYGWEVKPEPGA